MRNLREQSETLNNMVPLGRSVRRIETHVQGQGCAEVQGSHGTQPLSTCPKLACHCLSSPATCTW